MAKVTKTYDDLLEMAKSYGVDRNALFLAAAKQYDLQQRVIEMLKEGIEDGEMTTKKNVHCRPVKRLCRSACERTAETLRCCEPDGRGDPGHHREARKETGREGGRPGAGSE